MKKLIVVMIIFVVITFFIIENKKESSKDDATLSYNLKDEKRAIFISYIELQEYLKEKDIEEGENAIKEMVNNLYNDNFNMIILHVRPFSDAVYKSSIFPYSKAISKVEGKDPGYDVLEVFINEAHKKNMQLHAWVNPYRIRNTTDTSDISKDNPAYKYLDTNNVKVIENKGIFYNPASDVVTELIIDGIKEIISNYNVDGIHFDDYFYPDDTIDLENYQEYIDNGGMLSLSDYRLNNTSNMIKKVYETIKKVNKNITFGISPEGNINNNYDSNYIDTKKILSEEGYIDYIMPQIYFGFSNELMPFMDVINMWNSLIKVKSVKLMPALAFYKAGISDTFAKSGEDEWICNNDIIKKQVLTSRNVSNYSGYSLFRYSYLYNDNYKTDAVSNEYNNYLSIVK
mgnify:CR=1 FL=1